MLRASSSGRSKGINFLRSVAKGAVAVALASVAVPMGHAAASPVTLRCTLDEAATGDAFVQYFVVDAERKTVSTSGETYRLGVDPNGRSGRVITNWSDTEITLINEEWIRNGWQRFRIVTVLDRLAGAIRIEGSNASYHGYCAVADTAKKIF